MTPRCACGAPVEYGPDPATGAGPTCKPCFAARMRARLAEIGAAWERSPERARVTEALTRGFARKYGLRRG